MLNYTVITILYYSYSYTITYYNQLRPLPVAVPPSRMARASIDLHIDCKYSNRLIGACW